MLWGSGMSVDSRTKQDGGSPERGESADAPIDYGHRHFVNLIATVVLLFLAVASIWTIRAFDSYETRQRCINSGRKDCIPVAAPPKGMVQFVR
ncbi:hypothetical protein QBC99_002562 [Beijerinckia sp. GAS462]|nr:hypothetical protein [Beijerinckia sp. GAS462]SEC47719.1 hypothetical protein SAMN05443249_2783 [Beijerinckia sp. 28-YEA-48]